MRSLFSPPSSKQAKALLLPRAVIRPQFRGVPGARWRVPAPTGSPLSSRFFRHHLVLRPSGFPAVQGTGNYRGVASKVW